MLAWFMALRTDRLPPPRVKLVAEPMVKHVIQRGRYTNAAYDDELSNEGTAALTPGGQE